MSTPYAFVARIEAKPDKADEVAALLIGALPLAEAEPGTVGLVRGTDGADHVLDLRYLRQRRRARGAYQRRDRGGTDGQGGRTSRRPAGDPRRRRTCQKIELAARLRLADDRPRDSSTVLAKIMGHESSAITAKRHVHLFDQQRTDESVRQAMSAF